jgi:hypothetical protein
MSANTPPLQRRLDSLIGMAGEWVAPVAGSMATVVVGLAGIIAAYKAGNRQQHTALAVVRQQADAQAEAAQEERRQRRLETSYEALLAYLSQGLDWVLSVYPLVTHEEGYTMPPLPELPDRHRVEAVVTAYWSPRIRQLMEEWQQALEAVRREGFTIASGQRALERGELRPALGERMNVAETVGLPAAKLAVWDVADRIREQVRLELLGKHEGSAQ